MPCEPIKVLTVELSFVTPKVIPLPLTGTLVFTLPTRYKEYEDIILKAINKYISASDMPVILFEDKDNEEVIN